MPLGRKRSKRGMYIRGLNRSSITSTVACSSLIIKYWHGNAYLLTDSHHFGNGGYAGADFEKAVLHHGTNMPLAQILNHLRFGDLIKNLLTYGFINVKHFIHSNSSQVASVQTSVAPDRLA